MRPFKGIKLDEDWLMCPAECAESLLHHGRVRVVNREVEDGQRFVTEVNGRRAELSTPPMDTAMGRRHRVEIEMICEHCGPVGFLQIEQQKGGTRLTMETDVSSRGRERIEAWERRARDPENVSLDDLTWETRE